MEERRKPERGNEEGTGWRIPCWTEQRRFRSKWLGFPPARCDRQYSLEWHSVEEQTGSHENEFIQSIAIEFNERININNKAISCLGRRLAQLNSALGSSFQIGVLPALVVSSLLQYMIRFLVRCHR